MRHLSFLVIKQLIESYPDNEWTVRKLVNAGISQSEYDLGIVDHLSPDVSQILQEVEDTGVITASELKVLGCQYPNGDHVPSEDLAYHMRTGMISKLYTECGPETVEKLEKFIHDALMH
ncbi:hypothetical protein KIPB_000023 [Kipferlia bialata]|uniref:Uncharacterized protein n=1 Tax=Kipferlia bialata TaxID=797122 RepID=A0A9K3GEE6_9EUKA|nr:hypothetical protein KIPB_000023 [Kipferlia bialata]|eukprot:g23.t1